MGSILVSPEPPAHRRAAGTSRRPRRDVPVDDPGSNRRVRLVIDATVTAKTDLGGLGYDVSAKLEKIVGVSVHGVAYASPADVLIRRSVDDAPRRTIVPMGPVNILLRTNDEQPR